ncbi:MAG: response regulator [Bacteroidota bacterium]
MQKFSILYVDDEESNLQGFKSIYFKDYNILTATSGREAFKILEEYEVQIIFADQKMPEMSGVEFLNNIVTKYPDPIRIIVTGYSDIDTIIKAINGCGIYRYLTKPWDVKEMDAIINQALEKYSLQQENQKLLRDLQSANQTLEERAIQLETQNKQLEEYAFINAHELRGPVATIIGLVSLFEHNYVDDHERADIVGRIKQAANELNSVTKEIRNRLEENHK